MEHAPKRLKRLIRDWAGVAHDRELSKGLLELSSHFDRWKRGEIAASDLNDLIHRFHDGVSRDVWKTYATNRPEPAVAFAVASGILHREELPPELVQHLAGLIEFYETDRSAS
jgi:hypothetical protein